MITINKGVSNQVIFTLYEKSIGNNPYFLQLYSNQNKDNTLIVLSGDTSPNTIRWNQFTIDDSLYNLQSGTYDYYCHQYTGGTISLSASTNIVESGKCIVEGTGFTQSTYNNATKQNYTFE
jgi:hypothetical protein